MISPGDLSQAYRSVKIHPSNYQATGMQWTFAGRDTYMVDTRLPFGARKSCQIFSTLTQAVVQIMKNRGISRILIYMDDFLIITSSQEEGQLAQKELIKVLRELGFHINYKKVAGPSQKLAFLGITFDTVNMTLSLSQEKLKALQVKFTNFWKE